jgi:hypothetical protein
MSAPFILSNFFKKVKSALDKSPRVCYNKDTKEMEVKIMIIATIHNTKTNTYFDEAFRSVENATKTITSLNEHRPKIGFLMLVDWRDAEPEEIAEWHKAFKEA